MHKTPIGTLLSIIYLPMKMYGISPNHTSLLEMVGAVQENI